ncbi:M23 family peptidase [Bacillus licheniformis]|nr:M23 family peptidase [Bacillus licheniformis]
MGAFFVEGDKIEQNQVIGKAGKNLYNEEGGNHVHFEIRKDGVALNPLNFMDKPVSSIEKAMEEQASEVKEPADYNNTYSMSKGIDLAEKDGKTFDVSASLSGTVIKAAKDPVLGYVVEVEHEDGLSTVYQSLSEVSVKSSNNDVKDQLADDGKKSAYDNRDDAVEVGKPVENVAMPVADSENVSVVKKFFETDATKEEKEAALVQFFVNVYIF